MKKFSIAGAFAVSVLFSGQVLAAGLLLEAESFTAHGGGEFKKVTDRARSSGRGAIGDWNDKGQWAEWTVTVPDDGDYRIMLRYAGGRPWKVWREVKIDGAVPAGLAKIELPYTGGWGHSASEWRNLVAATAGKPVTFKLTKGKHTVRITNLGGEGEDGGGNLDAVVLYTPDSKADSWLKF